jgi:hypothetical protein
VNWIALRNADAFRNQRANRAVIAAPSGKTKAHVAFVTAAERIIPQSFRKGPECCPENSKGFRI